MKKLLTIILVLSGLCLGWIAKAQDAAPGEKSYKVYCEIISEMRNIFSNKTTVELDFGQAAGFWTGDRRLYDQNGKAIVFNSTLDAANYMARRGWVLEQAFPVVTVSSGDSNSPVYHWIMSKMVTDDSQITEGLIMQKK